MKYCLPIFRGTFVYLVLMMAQLVAAVADQNPDPDGLLISDGDFFNKLDLSRPGLSGPGSVAEAVGASNYPLAKRRLLTYFRTRTGGPVLNEIVGQPYVAGDITLSTDLDHNFLFYGFWLDVDNPDTPTDEQNANYPFGDVDWRYTPDEYPSEWLALLVRFDCMNRVVADWVNKGRDEDHQQINNMVTMACDFIADIGTSGTVGERLGYKGALQTAVRLQNWTNNYFELIKAPDTVTVGADTYTVAQPERMIGMLKYMWKMAEYTATDSNSLGIDNNRGFIQAKSLHLFATYFPEFLSSDGWITKAVAWTQVYMHSNIHPNGALAEPAPNYHTSQTTALGNMQALAQKNGDFAYEEDGEKLVGRMLTYWGDVVQPDGNLVLIGDSSLWASHDDIQSVALRVDPDAPEPTDGRLPRQDIRYITSSYLTPGAVVGKPPGHTSISYGHGASIMRTGWTANDRMVFIENEPSGNHSHPDDLSISLYGYGKPLILNSGRKSYDNASTLANWHDSETEANSTVQIDSRPVKSFAHRTNSWITNPGFDFYDGEYRDSFATGIPATDDTYIHQGNPDLNYGGETAMNIKNHPTDNSYDRIAYLKFRPGNVLENISSATLRLYCTTAFPGATVRINIHGLSQGSIGIEDDWNELNATWNDKSRNHASSDGVIVEDSDAIDLGYLDISATGWYSFDSEALRAFIAEETASGTRGQITLALSNEGADNKMIAFGTRKSNFRPALQIATSGGPWTDIITHRRKVYSDRNDLYIVSDLLTGGTRNHSYEQLWSLNPQVAIGSPSLNAITGRASAVFITSDSDTNQEANVQIATADLPILSNTPELKNGWVTFNVNDLASRTNKRVVYTRVGTGAVTFDTAILAGDGGSPADFRVDRLPLSVATDVATAIKVYLSYGSGDTVYYYLSHGPLSTRSFDTFQTDGELAVVRKSGSGALQCVSIKGARRLLDGSKVLINVADSPAEPIPDLSIDYRISSKLILFSSKPLQQKIELYSESSITSVEFNGESVPFSISGNIYTIERKILFSEDFENGVASRWIQSGSGAAFSVVRVNGNNVLEQSAESIDELPANVQAVAGESTWSDCVIEAKLQVSGIGYNSDRVGLLARHTGSGNCYGFVYDRYPDLLGDEQGKLRIYKKIGSTITSLAVKNYMLHLGSTYTFKAVLNGTSLRFFVNGKAELTATASSVTMGKAGIIADQADVWFDDFTVTGPKSAYSTPEESALQQTLYPSGNTYAGINSRFLNQFDHFIGDSNAFIGLQTHPTDPSGLSNRVGYIKFPMTSYRGGSLIGGASLWLYGYMVKYYEPNAPSTTVSIYAISDLNWNDRQVTWENRPGQGSSVFLGSVSVKDPGWYEFSGSSLLSYLQSHASDPEVSFMLVSENNDKRVEFFSNVYANRPELIISK